MGKKKVPLTIKEHRMLAEDLRDALVIMEHWVDRFYTAFSVKGKEVKQMERVIGLLRTDMPLTLDNSWYRIPVEEFGVTTNQHLRSPYYKEY